MLEWRIDFVKIHHFVSHILILNSTTPLVLFFSTFFFSFSLIKLFSYNCWWAWYSIWKKHFTFSRKHETKHAIHVSVVEICVYNIYRSVKCFVWCDVYTYILVGAHKSLLLSSSSSSSFSTINTINVTRLNSNQKPMHKAFSIRSQLIQLTTRIFNFLVDSRFLYADSKARKFVCGASSKKIRI